ncbi:MULTISPECIES: DEAD/DEAH box helicase [Subtercola]|uniref:DEAD/DEAH box helicase n=1 Tax=Subtercola vilae TaxID=2056433 RepID=A0A4T2C0K1_9MICO|nr:MULTISPECIES: DEAD/DEAH box helicase [Subtercola]MEA9984448.1 SNF2-related protein [Subtercola sp. RTI3]TIH37783.1 hypothetical protein D4765_07145 [Subtercola vilae]
MSSSAFPLVDAADIARLVGRPSFDRARPYARGSAVANLVWNAETRTLTAAVQGSEGAPYRCSVTLDESNSVYWVPVSSSCSCPVRFDCKHVAAALLASNAAHVRRPVGDHGYAWVAPGDLGAPGIPGGLDASGTPATGGMRTPDADAERGTEWLPGRAPRELGEWYSPASEAPAPAAAEAQGWRQRVGALSQPGASSAAAKLVAPARGGQRSTTAMGLQFEVREFVPRSREQWRGPTTKAAREPKATDDPLERAPRRLGVRPVVRSAAGSYIKASVSWGSFTHQVNRLNLNPEHHRWFAQFAAVQRATRELYTGQENDWLYLDDFSSPLLWGLLDEAAQLGIPLLGTKKASVVKVGAGATVRLDASRAGQETAGPGVAERGDLVLSASVVVDTAVRPASSSGAIGDHGVYTYDLARSSIVLAPTVTAAVEPTSERAHAVAPEARADETIAPGAEGVPAVRTRLGEEERALLGHVADVVVPADEVGEFFETFYPRLRRAVTLVSSDETVEFPEIAPPVLVLTARFRAKNVLSLDWSWQYGSGEHTQQLPLYASTEDADADADGGGDGDERDTAAERHTLGAVLRALEFANDAAAEIGARSEAFEPVDPARPLNASLVLQGFDAAVFTEKTLPILEHLDAVQVDIVGKRPDYRELTGDPELTITTVESDKRDWFDLGIIVNVGGYRVPFGPLFKALSKGETKLLMVDKTYLTLDHPSFDRLRELLAEASALAEWDTGVRISRYQASLWSEFEDLAEETVQAVAWREAVSGLNTVTSIRPTPLPATVDASLRPYQLEGFHWLAFLYEHGLGGILGDDMGLGKTLQTLALVAHARGAAPGGTPPFLVVAPTSVVSNWLAEAARFTPSLVVSGVTTTQAKGKRTVAQIADGADIVVTSYALFRLDFAAYSAVGWSGLILDEAQFVKNHTSKLHECATALDAPFKLAITGTPLENNLMELWSLFDIVAPGLFASAPRFQEAYVRPIEKALDPTLLPKLRRRIRPLLMRRTKELVAPELPAKQEQTLQVALLPAHQALYDTFFQRERQKLLGLIDDLDRNRFIVFRSLTLLRMLSLDASLIDEKYADVPSSKLNALFEQLDDVVAEGHRALVFSQFTSFLGKAATRLTEAGIEFEYLDGSTRRRPEVIARFKSGTAPVFLISLKAGGFGLNLTEADYVFMLDPWWNPATENQAIDRTHRIGQTKSVNVYRLVATGTIEEKVMALKEQKAKLFDAVMDDDAVFSTALTADDIRGLLDV